MKEQPLISIIVPVYNVEKYLVDCVNSIVNQTYENTEIILVDDGSKDDSGKVCDEFAAKDKRIIVKHKNNCGVSAARNTGLQISRGKFVTFVDADDTVTSRFIQALYEMFDSTTDMTVCGFNICDDKENNLDNNADASFGEDMVLTREKAVEIMLYGKLFAGHCWNKMFRADVLGDLRFDENIAVYEDLVFVIRYFLKSKKIKYCSRRVYNYFKRECSALHGGMSDGKLSAFKALDMIDGLLRDIYGNRFDELVNYDRVIWTLDCYRSLYHDKKNRNTYHPFLKSKLKGNKKNRYLSKKDKGKLFLLSICPTAYYFALMIAGK